MILEMAFGLSLIQTIHIEDSISFSAKKEIKSVHPIAVDGRSVDVVVEDDLYFTNFDVKISDYFKDVKRDFGTKDELTKYVKDVLCKVEIQSWNEVSLAINSSSRNLKTALNPWLSEITPPMTAETFSLDLKDSESSWQHRYWPVNCPAQKKAR